MPVVPPLRRRPRALARLTADAPALLARPGTVVAHVATGGLGELASVLGLEGVERVRAEVLARATAHVGRAGLVAATGDVVVVVAPASRVHGLPGVLTAPFATRDRDGAPLRLPVPVRVGVAPCRRGDALPDLLDAAAAAARTATARCADVVVAGEAERTAAADRRHVEGLLRRAVPDGLLRLHLQPLVDLETGQVTGGEALVRLQDGDRLLPPGAFVPLAEATGLVVEIGTWVLRETCRQLAALRSRHPGLQTLAVNVSACQVARPDFSDVVLGALADRDLPASALVLELTESVLLEAGPAALGQLLRLQAHGVRTGVDDFGTGYASLTYLRTLPVSFVKVDRSFVAGLPDSAPDAAVVRAVVGLAAELDLECVAEGIETAEQLRALRALGAVRGQGYLLSRPVPAEQFAGALSGSLLPGAAVVVPRARAEVRG